MSQMMQGLQYALPEVAVLITAATALSFEMLRMPRAALGVALAGLSIATALTLRLLGIETDIFGGTLRIDRLSIWAKLVLLPATALALLLARAELAGSEREGTVYSLLCFVSFGAVILAGSGDLMFVVLGVLLASLGSFALVAYPRTDPATEAAMKFFVFASVTSGVMIFGLSYWYGATGSTLSSAQGDLARAPLAATLGLVGVATGLGYKAALAPFHFWAPDAYEGAPVSLAAYLSVVPKIGAVFALAQLANALPSLTGWIPVLAAMATLSMFWGYFAALKQTNLVRLLAYSSIAQAGYFLLGILAIGRSPLAIPAIIVFAAAYAAMNLGAFSVVQRIGRTLEDCVGRGRSDPIAGAALTVFLLSLVGVPPLAGFAGKFLLFGAAMDAELWWLAGVGALNSVLALAAYLRILVPLYRSPASGERRPADASPSREARALLTAVGVVTLLLTLALGIGAENLLDRLR